MRISATGEWTGPVFVVAPGDVVLFFRSAARVLADVPRIPRDEVEAAAFYGLDGELLTLDISKAHLRWDGRFDVGQLTAALASVGGPDAPAHPRVIANEVLENEWADRWPRRPQWLHRAIRGRVPPTV